MKPAEFKNLNLCFDDFVHFLTYEKRFTSNTLKSYRIDLVQFDTFLIDAPIQSPRDISHKHVRQWIAQLMSDTDKKSVRTVHRKISMLKTYFKFLKRQNQIDADPMRKIVLPKLARRLPSTVTQPQMDTLQNLETFQYKTHQEYNILIDQAIIETLYGTGIRHSELLGLKINDIDFLNQRLKVLGKGKKERFVPFGRTLSTLLQNFISKREQYVSENSDNKMFIMPNGAPMNSNQLGYRVKRILSQVTTAEQRSPHTLRHSYATHLANNGANLNAIKTLLGHANLSATQIYTHNSVEKLRRVYEQAHPKAKRSDKNEEKTD